MHRFCEFQARPALADAEPFARFGHACRGYDQLEHDQKPEFHRAVFHQAYRLMSPLPGGLLGPWKRLFDRLMADKPLTAGDLAWAAERAKAAYHQASRPPVRRHGQWCEPDADRDVPCGRVLDALSNARHGGNSRGLARLYTLAEPSGQQAARWLDDLGTFIAHQLAVRGVVPDRKKAATVPYW
ncbi:hypothetical protein [Nonomuraea sp. NPDC049709]|uniref:hypothetical protein n=1 Tax=Nonomuraea sp. NPDC049709 TaxID=3154736 RepID=UPI00342CB85D